MNFIKAGEQGLYQYWLCGLCYLFLLINPTFCAAICLNANKSVGFVNLCTLIVLILSVGSFVYVATFKHLYIYYQQIVFNLRIFKQKIIIAVWRSICFC